MVREGLDIRALFGFMSRRPSSTRAWMRSAIAAAGVGLSVGSRPVLDTRQREKPMGGLPVRIRWESACVQVFGCRHDEAIHAVRRPASEKRQGTKSREVGHRRCRGRLWRFSRGTLI